MGGCYISHAEEQARQRQIEEKQASTGFKKFLKDGKLEDLISSVNLFLGSNKSGFIEELAKQQKLKIGDIPKEFPEIEYEIKFEVNPYRESGNLKEPGVLSYLDAFDFPASRNARFIKDPVHNLAEGVNSFFGVGEEEGLVVIEKCGGLYVKEKSGPLIMDVDVPFKEIIVKRTEERHASNIEEILRKVEDVGQDSYKGKIRKEKGDDFVLDTRDGRIYSLTFNRSHLIMPGETEETGIQRQLEVEYAGFIPGFTGHTLGSEEQIARGMVDMAKYILTLYSGAPIKDGWRMNLVITNQRKYDFVAGRTNPLLQEEPLRLPLLQIPEGAQEYVR